MTFRPYPGLTIACVLLFGFLCWLGFWQLDRLQWKLDLIAQVNRQLHARPIALDDGRRLEQAPQTDYQPVTLSGRFDNSKETYLFGTGPSGQPIYHVLVPFTSTQGHVYLVDRGTVPKDRLDPATRRAGLIEGPTRVTGLWRWPGPKGYFTPPADAAHRIWYWHDLAGIQAATGIRLYQPGVIDADAAFNPGGLPLGGQTVVTFRNQHLSYAVTWFGFALCLLGVWIAYHISKGRLGWK